MKRQGFPSDVMDQFPLRLPDGMREQIKSEAKANNRSMNAEIVTRLSTHAASDIAPLDLVWGADGIAAALRLERRQVFHMLHAGQLPAKKIGDRWVVSRRKLQELFE